MRLENELTKDEILEHYLNLVYFGNGAYGVQAAAERYFNKPLNELDAGRGGVARRADPGARGARPDQASRRRGPAARRRCSTRWSRPARSPPAQADAAQVGAAADAGVVPASPRTLDYYIDAVKTQLLDPTTRRSPAIPARCSARRNSAARNAVFRGGLQIYTKYDPLLQFAANVAIVNDDPAGRRSSRPSLVVDRQRQRRGARVAFGRSFDASAVQPRDRRLGPPGGLGVQGVHARGRAEPRATRPNDRVGGIADRWRLGPERQDAVYNLTGDCHGGTPTLTQAIAKSDNCAFVRTELSLGPGNYGSDGAQKRHRHGARRWASTRRTSSRSSSTTLGTNGVHPLEMAAGLLGDRRTTACSKRADVHLEDRRRRRQGAVPGHRPPGTRVLDAKVARTETQMLTGVLKQRHREPALGSIDRPAAGKTGTTDQQRRRLVRRLHAAVHDRGVDGATRRARCR